MQLVRISIGCLDLNVGYDLLLRRWLCWPLYPLLRALFLRWLSLTLFLDVLFDLVVVRFDNTLFAFLSVAILSNRAGIALLHGGMRSL